MKTPPRSLPGLALLTAGLLTSQFAAANTALWIGNPGVSASTNWSDNANWNNVGAGGAGPLQNDVKFGLAGAAGAAGTITSVADVDQHPFSLQFTNNSLAASPEFHTVLIPAGVTLTNDTTLIVGGLTLNGYRTIVDISGDGTLVQLGNLTIGNNGASSADTGTLLNLSGLSHFVYVGSPGTIALGSGNRSAGELRLAAITNFISAGTFNANTASSSSSATGTLTLGAGTNVLNVGTFNVAHQRNNCTVNFAGAEGGVRLRGAGGTDADRATMTLGNRSASGSGGTSTGTLALNGHPVDLRFGTLTVGQSSNGGASGNNIGTGNLNFDTGLVDATTLNLAVTTGNSFSIANGTVNVGAGGTLVIGSGGASLVNQGAGTGAATGNLNINGGAVISSNSIVKTTVAGTGNLTMTGGSLTLASGRTLGTAGIPLDNVNLTSATLQLSVANSAPVISAAALNLADSANLLNVAALPSIPSIPVQYPIATYTSLPGGGSLELGTLPVGYSGYLSNDTVNTIWLVITNVPFIAKTDVWGGAVNNEWNTTSLNWTNAGTAVAYNDGDVVIFDNSAQTGNVNLTGPRLPGALTVNNSLLNYVFSGIGGIGGPISLVKDGNASLTLSETGGDNFSGGILVNFGTVILDNENSAISGGLIVSSFATVQVGNNSTNGNLPAGGVVVDGKLYFNRSDDLAVAVGISGSGRVIKNGYTNLTLSGVSGFTGVVVVNSGTLSLTGAGSISNSSTVIVGGYFAKLDLSAAQVPSTFNILNLTTNAAITVAKPDERTPVNAASLSTGIPGNLINIASLPPIGSYPVTLKLIQSATAITGSPLTLGTLPTATPAYAGSIGLSADQTAVELTLTAGPVSLRPAVFWTGADAPNLNTNWSDRLNWQLPGAPTAGESAVFTDTASTSASSLTTPGGGSAALALENVNNRVDTGFTIASLIYSNLNDSYHNTELASGQTLSLTNTLTIGSLDTGASAQHGFVNISGAGTLGVNNPNANLQVWNGSGSVGGSRATLDLSALDNFTATAGRLTVGACAVNNAVNRPSGVLYLAKTNTLTLGFQTTTMHAGTTTGNAGIAVADCNGNAGSASSIYLGQVNTFSADTIGIGRQKASAHLLFNPIYSNTVPYPSVTFQGFSSSRVSDFSVGDGVGNTGTTTLAADADFTGGSVNLAADTINLGRASGGATGGGTTTGALLFDAGTITANTLNLGAQPVTGAKIGVGNLTVSSNEVIGTSGKLVVNGDLNIAVNVNSAATAGTLNINGGTVQANNIVAGLNGATSTINLNGGTLIVSNTAGTPAAPLTALNLTGGTLQLNADGNATTAALVATTITPNGTTLLNIGAITGVNATSTIPLISYTGADPFPNLTLGTYPAGYAVTLEDNAGNSTIDLRVVSTSKPKPFITGFGVVGTTLTLQGTNGASGGQYVVLGSTNVALPLEQWTPLFTNVFAPDGSFNLSTNVLNPALPRQFFLLSQ